MPTMEEPAAEPAQRVLHSGDRSRRRLHWVAVDGAESVAVLVGAAAHDAAVLEQVVDHGGAVGRDLGGRLLPRRHLRRAAGRSCRKRHTEDLPAAPRAATPQTTLGHILSDILDIQ
jgi:hypothetical protein